MNPVFRERYQQGTTALHRLDARVKLVMALLLALGVSLTPEGVWPVYALQWCLIAAVGAAGGLSAWRLGRAAAVALPFTLAAAALVFTTPGEPVAWAGGLVITGAGLARFLSIVLKSWLAVQAALLLAMTTPFDDILAAARSLKVPDTLVAIVGFMYRYLYVLVDEAQSLLRARAARSAALPGKPSGGSLRWRARVAGGMVGSLFLRSFERSERVYAAMLSRGYDGRLRGFAPPPLDWRSAGWAALPVLLMAVTVVLAFVFRSSA